MRRPLILVTAGLLATIPVASGRAHDLKVMASRLVAAPGDKDTVYISFGHLLPIDAQIDADTLDDYSLKTPSGSVVYLNKEGVSLQSNEIHVEEQGIYQAVATRKPSVFCEVVDKNGNHIHHRGPRSSVTEGTIENATRTHQFAKALLVSGATAGEPPAPLGHEIEVVPAEPPTGWRSGQDLAFRVLYKGRPLSGGELVAAPIGFKPDKAWSYATSTDAKGIAVVRPTQAGTWVLRVRTQKPASRDQQAEYDIEAYTATLVLEVRP